MGQGVNMPSSDLDAMNARATELGNSYRESGDLDSLEQAVTLIGQIAAATNSSDPDRSWHLHKLANALRIEDVRAEDDAVLAEAVRYVREVLAVTAPDDPDRVEFLRRLAYLLSI